MSSFDHREKAEEAKYAHDQETRFKVYARRNKLLGLWAAEKMDLRDKTAEAYAREIVEVDFEEPGEEDVYRRIAADLAAKKVNISEHRIRREMEDLLENYERQLLASALDASEGVKKEAARLLGISFRSLRYRLQKMGIDDDDKG